MSRRTTAARTLRAATPLCPLAAALAAAVCAVALCGCGKNWAAPQSYGQPPEQNLARARELATAAQRAERDGHDDQAMELYRQALNEYREFGAAWNNLGRLLMKKGEGLDAAQAFRLAADYDPKDATPLVNLGLLWEERGYPDEAANQYEQALKRDENSKEALRRSIYIDQRIRMKGDELTAQHLRRALLIEDDPQWRAFFLREKLRLDAALAESGTPVAHDPS